MIGGIGCLWACSTLADEGNLSSQLQALLGNTDPTHESWSVHAQATEILQGYPSFPAAYSGTNSLSADAQWKNTTTATLFLGRRLWQGGEVYFNPELYEGKGLSDSFGAAGFPNGEANKAGSWNFKYGDARLFVRQTIGLGGPTEQMDSEQNQLAGDEDISRVTLTAGKFSASDIFDNNSYSHDPRGQFMNWAIMESGAWDYPANARGYTQGIAVEFNQARWALRYGAFLEPKNPNANDLTFHGLNNLGQVAELEERHTWNGNPGKTHFLIFLNRDRGADFSDALGQAGDINASIDSHRHYGNSKYGVAVSAEQQVIENIAAFARLSWNNGVTEDYMFTQVDESAAIGTSIDGKIWGRSGDVAGIAGAINGLSGEQRKAVEEGYMGIMMGDGMLHYAPEVILEAYYALQVTGYATLSPDYQLIVNPAYNADRGPVNIFAARLHMGF